jgi:uncharacterized protein (TIGR02117 family)
MQRKLTALLTILLLVCSLPGCATDGACIDDATPSESVRSVYIVKRGNHTGIAFARADWPDRHWSVLNDFADSDYLEIGWGDERYYQAEQETLWLGLRAALWPTSSVVHVIGVRAPIVDHIWADDIVEVRVSVDGLRLMAEAIQREFTESSPTATPVSMRAAPKPNHFYSARGKFYFPRMCNWWSASRLREASCPIAPWTIVTAGQVMRKARSFQSATKQ